MFTLVLVLIACWLTLAILRQLPTILAIVLMLAPVVFVTWLITTMLH